MQPPTATRDFTRIAHEVKSRGCVVTDIIWLNPRMARVTLWSDALSDFASLSPDDHVKIFFPSSGVPDAVVARDFTPRRFDRAKKTLDIDFAVHSNGAAMEWLRSAKPGSRLHVAGPRSSKIVPPDFDWYLLIGDESALPAMGRRVEETSARTAVTTIASLSEETDSQTWRTAATHRAIWLRRPGVRTDEVAKLIHFAETTVPVFKGGHGFVWIAAEVTVARAVRDYFIEERRHPREWLRAAGYWKAGTANAHENLS